MKTPTVMIGMSGGVDSSVAALLLTATNMGCVGATMQLWEKQDTADAKAIADQLGIPHHVIDLRPEFRSTVVDSFVASYESGDTPNPCILCNRTMKFGLMLRKAQELGYDYVATGHYARVRQDPESHRFLLMKAADCAKDQTYFLYCLSQEQLAHTLFPLGELTKVQIREIAESKGLVTARKRDSQDICFIPDGDYAAFLRRYTGKDYPQGNYVSPEGQILGTHQGAVCYTVGQRRGLGIALGEPAYVIGKDMQANTVTVGPNAALMHRGLVTDQFNWIIAPQQAPLRCTGKIRHSQFDQPATLYPQPDGTCRAVFDAPQRAITPGQSAVFYQGDVVVGGGIIRSFLEDSEL